VKKVRARSHVWLARVNSYCVFHEAIYKEQLRAHSHWHLPLKAPGINFRLEAQRANYGGDALIPADMRSGEHLYFSAG
jgi:hypothetical protein